MPSPTDISNPVPAKKYPWLWDTDMGNDRFDEYLNHADVSSKEAQWAMLRLIEYAPYRDLRRMLPARRFVKMWPRIARRVRAREEREGMDFFHHWLTRKDVGDVEHARLKVVVSKRRRLVT